jgi:SAM-dependent methyltransferase
VTRWTPIERMVDALPANLPYEGMVAEAYDAWLPPGSELPGDAYLAELIDDGDGPGLELGSGNGRALIPLLEEGLDVDGVDSARTMNEICAAHARARGVDVTLHLADIAPLALGRRYRTITCPAGTFTLVDVDCAGAALASYLEHLEPGGTLGLALFVPVEELGSRFEWRLRRTGTRASDGVTFVAHEAVCCDEESQLQLSLTRIEAFDADGRLTDTLLRKQRLRWWRRPEIEETLRAVGYSDVGSEGSDTFWITTARRP